MRCRFNGEVLTYLEHGTELSLPGGRGLVEPSLVSFNGRYLLTLRNNERGYVAASGDGLVFLTNQGLGTFDDGEDLGSYQHLSNIGSIAAENCIWSTPAGELTTTISCGTVRLFHWGGRYRQVASHPFDGADTCPGKRREALQFWCG